MIIFINLSLMRKIKMKSPIQKQNYQYQEYKIRPLPEAILVGSAIFFAILITSFFIYHYSIDALKEEIKEGLVRTGSILAANFDGTVHQQLKSPDQEKDELYINAVRPLILARESDPSIANLYTAILKDDKIFFILDSTESGDADGDGVDDKAHIMDEYPEAEKELFTAFKTGKSTTSKEPYQDRWGSFVSGYIPFKNKNGETVGVIGIDIDTTNYFARLKPIERSTIRAIVFGFFSSFLVGSIVWFLRNFILKINLSRKKLYEDFVKSE
jgi:hypothetical protein